MDDSKKTDLDKALMALYKNYDETVVMDLSKPHKVLTRDCLSTGCVGVDKALGNGIVKGKVVEIFGNESGGKTTLALHIMAEAQKTGKVLFIDAENSFDAGYARALGVDTDALFVNQPDYSEQAFTVIETLVRTGVFSLVVVDSVAFLSPKAEVEGEAGDANMGLQARLMGQHLRKVSTLANNTKTTMLYINQVRDNIGGWVKTITPGGKALKFQASARISVSRISNVKDKEGKVVAITSKVKIVKNKMGAPFKELELQIRFGEGVDKESDLITTAIKYDVVQKNGAWFVYNENKYHGELALSDFIKENNLYEEITNKLKE